MSDSGEVKEFTTDEATGPLQAYERSKFELAALIHEGTVYAAEIKDEELCRKYQRLMTAVAEDRFCLSVVGESSRGKSTLMNAIVGMDRLPTGIVPMTSVITSVTYGTQEVVKLRFQGSMLSKSVRLDEMAQYITEAGNPGNQFGIEQADVQLPAEILRRGFCFVDTPGFGSVVLENTATTREFLPEVDAFVFVTSFDSPFSTEEGEFLREALSRNRKVFLVVNKLDLVSDAQRDEVLNFLRERVGQWCEQERLPVFAVSARNALSAKQSGDVEILNESGLPTLEAALISFLTDEKRRQILLQASTRLERLLSETNHERRESLRLRLAALFENLGRPTDLKPMDAARCAEDSSASLFRGCRVCGRVVNEVLRFLGQYQYDLSRTAEEQAEHARRNGFCAFHTWQYARLASPQGVCSAYPRLLSSTAERLRALAQNGPSVEKLRSALRELQSRRERCKACEAGDRAENQALADILLALQRNPEEKRSLDVPMCLPHLGLLVDVAGEYTDVRPFIERMAKAFERISESMQRYTINHEGLRRDLTSDEELRAPDVCLALLAGHRSVLTGTH
jgi:GTPase Era involved in 16S rRNA processing